VHGDQLVVGRADGGDELPHERKAEESSMAQSFDELVKPTTTKRTRQRAAARTPELLGELLLSEIRERAGKSQRQVADALGIKQPSLSKLEKQSDMQISTLRRIVNALGGELEVSARFPAGPVKIEPFNEMGGGEAVSP
jgi:predicted XRE-type DNA-binding protein